MRANDETTALAVVGPLGIHHLFVEVWRLEGEKCRMLGYFGTVPAAIHAAGTAGAGCYRMTTGMGHVLMKLEIGPN